MFATQVLSETFSDDNSEEEIVSEVVGYLIVTEKKYEVKKGETKIGRDSSVCSIVIENFTISKVHAVIESDGIDDTFIYDIGSTNQTKLGKKVLKPHCRYKLDNESKLTLGNVVAEFVLPPDRRSNSTLGTNKLNSENINPLDELGNIFELATQVTAPDSNISKIPIFEKLPESKCVSKLPNLVLPTEIKESSELSKSVFDEVTWGRLDSQKTTSAAISRNTLLENSNIFNLSTQCQLYESQAQKNKGEEKFNNNDSNKNSEVDKIISLLNDGQDDVLCIFMSLHSPKEQNNEQILKEIKTEVEDVKEVFDVPTETQPVIQESAVHKVKVIESSNKDIENDFSNKNLYKPSITSTPLIHKIKLNETEVSQNFSNQLEKDIIKTQDFNVEGEKSIKLCENVKNLSQLETLDEMSTTEQKDEDLILTQTFDIHECQQNIIAESEDINEIEDLMATQIYDEKNECLGKEISAKAQTIPPEISKNLHVEHKLDKTLDFTERNYEDDFIATQVFENTSGLRKNDKSLKRDSSDERSKSEDEEDFIATQSIVIPVNKTRICKSAQESRLETSSRESSLGVLGFKNTRKDSEDFITTQLFEVPECQTSVRMKSSEKIDSPISCLFKKEKGDCSIAQAKKPVILESSGDETESDLEIILDKTETAKTGECSEKPFKTESESKNSVQPRNLEMEENNSNSSYIFELAPENQDEKISTKRVHQEQRRITIMSDSDETDCEEIAIVGLGHSVKQEPLRKIDFEETQVLTLTLTDNCKTRSPDDDWMIGKESPKFEIGIENDLRNCELSYAQNFKKIGRFPDDKSGKVEGSQIPSKVKKVEVGITKSSESSTVGKFDSPLKRPLDKRVLDIIPIKKSKIEGVDRLLKSTEKKLLKLVQAHDISQIQPSRTRNSLKIFHTEDKLKKINTHITNEHPSSRRKTHPKKGNSKKLNGNIMPYLTTKKVETRMTSYRERIKKASPKEKIEPKLVDGSSRILRSSRRNSKYADAPVLNEYSSRNIPIRRSKRISRTKSEEYFTGSCVNIVFTGFNCEFLDKIISELGGKKTNDLSHGEVVVSDKVRRTVKFLCAMGLGLPITSPEWLLACRREKKFLNPWNFILKDEESEEKYDFDLKTSLERSKKVKLLEGFSIFATESTKPPVKDLLAIVECCGGTPLFNPPDIWPKKTIIVSCLEDKQWWPLPKFRNIKIVHYEFILGGVLKQKIDFKTYKLR